MDLATVTASGLLAVLINVIGAFWLKERLRQSIKHEYDQDLAKLKSELDFELDKKKRLYEGKLAQYKKYFALMDSYSLDQRRALAEGFQEGIFKIIENPSTENTIEYIKKTLSLQNDISDKFLMFKNEMNGLRLEAGEPLLELIERYVSSLEKVQERTVSFLGWMNENATTFLAQPEAAQQKVQEFMQGEASGEAKELMELQEKIFREMRRELGIV
ncbi:hypothetical protein SAMN04515663_10991 [Alcanivorax sp. DSM 26293]|uniref:hypothetical protein n=1 Tax=Gammaproteobacteria TaxID=1236 RepID=UPI0008A06618|nr:MULTISPECIES: hypothetical protein [Gammaproteobacteria]MBY6069874.1 hypothetical protein [Marinobacter salsuginis]SEG19903.1 hypothetical protein SAMN04515663_10991 [Alcanivorax sp. DSM 26293]|tara:strand:- start:114 stop:761 length:648 start_codon:yes stop_codon:yes gene_type:complete